MTSDKNDGGGQTFSTESSTTVTVVDVRIPLASVFVLVFQVAFAGAMIWLVGFLLFVFIVALLSGTAR